jgi:hypothetical protein
MPETDIAQIEEIITSLQSEVDFCNAALLNKENFVYLNRISKETLTQSDLSFYLAPEARSLVLANDFFDDKFIIKAGTPKASIKRLVDKLNKQIIYLEKILQGAALESDEKAFLLKDETLQVIDAIKNAVVSSQSCNPLMSSKTSW